MKHRTILICFILSLLSCEKVVEKDFAAEDPGILSVECILTNEKKHQLVRLGRVGPDLNQGFSPASGALVQVIHRISPNRRDTFTFPEDHGSPGDYYSTGSFRATVTGLYQLNIIWEDRYYRAFSGMDPGIPLNRPVYLVNDSGYYELPHPRDPDVYMMEYKLWDPGPDTQQLPSYLIYYYSLENIDVMDIFQPDQQEIAVSPGSVWVRRKYSLTQDHRDYLRGILMETTWRGGLLDVARSNPATNIRSDHEVVGFFSASTVVGDTLVLE